MNPKSQKADILKFISENQKISGFSGHISEATASHEPDMAKIAKDAGKFGAQIPVQIGGRTRKYMAQVLGVGKISPKVTHLMPHQVIQILRVNMVRLDELVRDGRVIRQEWGEDETLYPIEQFL